MINYTNLRIGNPTTVISVPQLLSFTLPSIERVFDTERRISFAGEVPIPVGFAAMTLEFSMKAIDDSVLTILSDITGCSFIFTGAEQQGNTFRSHGCVLTGFPESVSLGEFAPDGVTYNITAMINSLGYYLNNIERLYVDYRNYIYRVNGANQFDNIASVIGVI